MTNRPAMKKSPLVAWTVVTLALAAGLALLFRQHQVRTASLAEARAIRQRIAATRAQLVEFEQKRGALSDALARTTPAASAPDAAPANQPSPAEVLEAQRAAMRAAMAQAFRQMLVGHEMRLERDLHPKFDQLGLTSEQWEKYKQASLDLQHTRNDAMLRGVRGEEFATLTRQAEEACQTAMRAAVGEPALAELQAFDQRLRRADERAPSSVRELSNALLFAGLPLQPEQSQRLVALIESAPNYHRSAGLGDVSTDSSTRAPAPVNSATVLAEAERILTPAQLETFRRWAIAYDHVTEVDTIVRQQAVGSQATIGLPKK